MHVTIIALGSRGDVWPYAVLGQGLVSAGYQVRFVTFKNFEAWTHKYGMEFHQIRGDAQALTMGGEGKLSGFIKSFGSLAQGYADDLSAPQLGETDLIINQLPAGLFGYDLSERFNVPIVLAAVIPLTRTNAFPLMGFPKLPIPGYNRITYRFGQQVGWQMFRAVINRWRKETLGLEPLSLTGYSDELIRNVPVLNGFSEHIVPRPDDWGNNVHVTGYWFPQDKDWEPPEDLKNFIEGGNPPVFCLSAIQNGLQIISLKH